MNEQYTTTHLIQFCIPLFLHQLTLKQFTHTPHFLYHSSPNWPPPHSPTHLKIPTTPTHHTHLPTKPHSSTHQTTLYPPRHTPPTKPHSTHHVTPHPPNHTPPTPFKIKQKPAVWEVEVGVVSMLFHMLVQLPIYGLSHGVKNEFR